MTRTRRQPSPFTEATEPTVHSAISALLSFSISLPIYSVTNNACFYRSTTSLDRTLPTYCLAEWRPRPPSMELCVVSMELWARHMDRHCVVDKIVTFWGAEFPFFSAWFTQTNDVNILFNYECFELQQLIINRPWVQNKYLWKVQSLNQFIGSSDCN